MRAKLPFLAGVFVLAACAETDHTMIEPAYSTGPVLEQASGSGHIVTPAGKREFTFTAHKRADGTASGRFNVLTAAGLHVTGEVTCLRVLGNEAWVGGVTESGIAEGTHVGFRVVDGGEGANAADRISFVFNWRECTSAGRMALRPIDQGNIQVKGEPVRITEVYRHDFETPAGSEWSNQKRSTAPNGQRFLGDFAAFQQHGVTLALNGLPAHGTLRITFDFYAIRTLDGNIATYGLDLFTFGESTSGFSFSTTFSAFGGAQSFPGAYPSQNYGVEAASGLRTLGYVWNGPNGAQSIDATYPVELNIEHSGSSALFTFSAAALQALVNNLGVFTDESWGIDNVRVYVIR